ncbi:hypothetical protein LTR97_001165 [Elasticomyces elasticus]|uniref:BTB domain-containing protein n=1 Tax=Elasticomyces elasticus TaxID=574655 RepID=A0AAN7ZQA8_9PEZI|nr:hypothetical protein LTR97_001165 [Elasticomyces elasticus]
MVFLIPRDTPYWRPGAEASEPETKSVQPPAPNIHALSELAKGLSDTDLIVRARLYCTDLYCDLSISCGGQTMTVHKILLHTQSTVFRKMLSGSFKEANESTLTLDHDDPAVLGALIHYFYHFELNPELNSKSDAAFVVRVYAMADKYDIPTLCSPAIDRLQRLLEPEREHVKATISAIQAIDNYTSGNQLWDIVVPMIVSNMDWLSQEEEFLKFLVEDMPVLTKTLLGSMAAEMPYNVRGMFR